MNFSGTEFTTKKKKGWIKILLILAILFGLIFALNVLSSQIKNSVYTFSFPLQKLISNTGKTSSGWIGSLLNTSGMSKENDNLRKENQKLLATVSILQSIQEGNQALTEISATCQDKNFSTVMAGITGLDSQDMLTINKGLNDGLIEGMPVIDQYNVLYGKIFKVYKNFSQVMLISNKNSVVNVQIQQTNNQALDEEAKKTVNGIIKGNGELSIYLDLVPVDDEIKNDDVLVTSALDQVFPKNILVGKITKVQKNDQKPFQQAEINPFYSLDDVENLFVITNYQQ